MQLSEVRNCSFCELNVLISGGLFIIRFQTLIRNRNFLKLPKSGLCNVQGRCPTLIDPNDWNIT